MKSKTDYAWKKKLVSVFKEKRKPVLKRDFIVLGLLTIGAELHDEDQRSINYVTFRVRLATDFIYYWIGKSDSLLYTKVIPKVTDVIPVPPRMRNIFIRFGRERFKGK